MAVRSNFFDPVDPKADFVKREVELLKDWYEEGVVAKYLKKNKASQKRFSFLDGPITANNPMGVHHAWGRTYKDFYQRYKNMKGFRGRFHNGFDSQGLWVEVEVEKELGFKNKKDIEKYGVEKFVEKCKERVVKYAQVQTEQSKRLGYFMDWDNSYFTMSDANNYMIWHFLKVVHDSGWLYKGADSVPWCPRCETAISQHEILTEDYKEVTHDSIFLELPIEGREREFLLVWTTTPWTIPANIAVAVDTKLDYALVEGSTKDLFWVAKEAVKRIFGDKAKVVKEAKGEDLVGLRYEAPFDNLPAVAKVAKENKGNFHQVVATNPLILPINTEEGTGLVHTAVSAGSEDFKLGKELGLPMVAVIGDNGAYLEGFGFLSGKNAKDDPRLVLDYLLDEDKKEGVDWVFDITPHKHRYPTCWRCKTELVWKVTDEWYIAMDRPLRKVSADKSSLTFRERMKRVAKKIRWIPGFGLKRELDWLENMSDWLISKKNRYWGLCLPIWECAKCGHFEVIGSLSELKEKAVEGWKEFEGKSPHKPQLDQVKIKCAKCGEIVSRIEPVGNPWLDAGIVAYSTISEDNQAAGLEDRDTKPLYATDKKKWRTWFPADFITESFPGQFKNWFYALIAMSVSLEDEEPTKTIFGFATLFGENGEPMHKSSGNMVEFNEGAERMGVDVMRFIFLKQNPAENLLFGYRISDEVRRQFHLKLWNVYNFFVTYANLDGWRPGENDVSDSSPLDNWILSRLAETEREVDEFIEAFQAHKAAAFLEDFVDDLSNWYVRRSRERLGANSVDVKDKKSFYQTCYFVLVNLAKILAPFTPFLADSVFTNLTKEESVHLTDWPEVNYQEDKKLLEEMKVVREVVEKVHSERKLKGIPVRQPLSILTSKLPKVPDQTLFYLLKDEVNVKDWQVTEGKEEHKLDATITPELEEEAKARELIREIQKERKEMNISFTSLATVWTPSIPQNEDLKKRVMEKTLTSKLLEGEFKVRED